MEKLSVFEPFNIKNVDYKITCIDYLEGYIYIGTKKGKVYR